MRNMWWRPSREGPQYGLIVGGKRGGGREGGEGYLRMLANTNAICRTFRNILLREKILKLKKKSKRVSL